MRHESRSNVTFTDGVKTLPHRRPVTIPVLLWGSLIYHKVQMDLTYNSNHIEDSRLTHDQTRYIFETNTNGFGNEAINVDDVIEAPSHFRCIDMVIG